MVNVNQSVSASTIQRYIANNAANGIHLTPAQARQRILGMTSPTGTSGPVYRPNPTVAKPGVGGGGSAADKWLNDIMSGKNLPFNAQVQAAQISEQSDMNAAGEAARNGQLDATAAAGGASASDPSLQGARASNFARRQTDNQTSVRDINQRGSLMNFNAQQQAAGQLNSNQMQREGWAQEAAMEQQRVNAAMAAQGSQGGQGNSRQRESGNGGSASGFWQPGGSYQQANSPTQRYGHTSGQTRPPPAGQSSPAATNPVPPFLRPVSKPQSPGIWAGPAGSPKPQNGPYTAN